MSKLIEREISAAICALVATIPPHDATKRQRADYQIRKAEVLDLIAATHPAWAAQATTISARARHEARAIAVDY
jgi:hypothetical protein